MSRASRARDAAVLLAGGVLLASCTSGPAGPAESSSPTPSASGSTTPVSPEPTPSPTSPQTLPPLTPGTTRGVLLVVQQAEDASLVAGDSPIRLTLARTGNRATWFTSPPQKLSGTMTTEQAMLTLGWRPSDDGTTARLPSPRPNGVLSYAGGSLAFTAQRASVRPDGTLVLDIKPISGAPETIESYGPVTLTLDGAPGVLEFQVPVGALTVRVVVTGERNQQAAVQIVDPAGEILEAGFLAPARPVVDTWLDMTSGTTTWSDPVVTLVPPQQSKQGSIRVSGTVTVDGVAAPLDQVIARWSLPLVR
jgi:hypothetical protein